MEEALKAISGAARDPRLLLGHAHADDAGIVALTDEIALVQTIDFLTPIVDDPYDFGRVAATNALSDVYAMGGRPLSVLNVVCFPDDALPAEVLGRILAGGLRATQEAGAVLAGGHSVSDAELKYGLAVTGVVHPKRFWANAHGRPGDVLVLTKGLGVGLLATAGKRGELPAELHDVLLATLTTSNAAASAAARAVDDARPGAIGAVTDVTGFGLVGHAAEIARASGLRAVLRAGALPVLPFAEEAARRGFRTRGERTNTAYAGLEVAAGVAPERVGVATDPQTAGGLLVGVRPDALDALRDALTARGALAAVVGALAEGAPGVELRG